MQKKIFLLIATAFFVSNHLFAQDVVAKKDTSYWKKKAQFGANFNQSGFSDSWAPGGASSYGLNLFFNKKGEYARDKTTWVNDLQLQIGFIDAGNGVRKSIDRIFFDSKVGHKLSKTWSLVGGLNFQTQFVQGFNYTGRADGGPLKNSNFLAPAFLTEYVGLEWKPKPHFNVVFAPAALRQTIVNTDDVREVKGGIKQTAYGVPFGQELKNDVGIVQITANYDKDIAKNVNLKLRYNLFIDANKLASMDNRLDAKLAAKINKYFSATFDLIALYDDDLGTDKQRYNIQLAHNIGLGFLYTF
ncbi:MAG: DUF3078 domain-containing protein [Arcicella sp.]|nr:DUF3078 domain-containing protein [Arcicella sp.]